MSRDTGIGSTSGSLRPGVIAVGVNEDLYCLFNSGDLVKGFRHADRRYPFRSAETGHKKTGSTAFSIAILATLPVTASGRPGNVG